jgi:hypothetical protein
VALQFDKIEFPFAKGLNQKSDARLINAPDLVRAVNVEVDDTGGLRTRLPYAAESAVTVDGLSTSVLADCRRIIPNGNELVMFTKDSVYSWSSQTSTWRFKAWHEAIAIDEQPTFVSTGDQAQCDRAELNGTIVYAWVDSTQVYAGAIDKATGAVLVNAYPLTAAARPRVVALATKVLLFTVTAGGALQVQAIDPASPYTGIASTPTSVSAINGAYDVEKIPLADTAIVAARLTPTTSYLIAKVTAALSVSTSTKARTCDGPIAVACTTDGVSAQIARGNSTNIQGDLVTVSSLADVFTAQALGAGAGTINQITSAFTSTTQCIVLWHSSESAAATDWSAEYNSVSTANVIGSETRLIRRLGVASRAFAHEGRVYVWLAFAGESSFSGASPSAFRAQLQNTYFLYTIRALGSVGSLASKATFQNAGGFSAIQGHLPGVASVGTGQYAWCGTERRIIPIGDRTVGQLGYSDRGPHDIVLTFDSNAARRCARLGDTLYITGGELLQYDGAQTAEASWHLYPHYFGAIEVGAGNLEDGTYTSKPSWRWDNARGERDRSAAATAGQVTIAGGPNGISTVSWTPLYVTRKTSVVAEMWRTAKNAGADAPFYLVTSQDPTSSANPNRFIPNDGGSSTLPTFNDEFSDTTLTTKESHPENGNVLENLAPPGAQLVAASAERLFIGGVSDRPHEIWYSKQRQDNEVVSFHEVLRVPIPPLGGTMTAIAMLGQTPIVFREASIYSLEGVGLNNVGEGFNFEPRLLSADVGAVNQESVALTPVGLVFKSSKGWYRLAAAQVGAVEYIGAGVVGYDSETVHAAHVVETQHQVRVVTSGRVIVWDYLVNAWFEWSVSDGLHACVWDGQHRILAATAMRTQQTTFAAADYGVDVEMLVRLSGIQGFARCRKVLVLGEYRSGHTLRIRVGKYAEDTYFDDKTWTPSPTSAGAVLQVKHGPSQQQHQAMRVRITSTPTTNGEQLRLSALSLECGIKPGTFRQLPATQRQ